MECPRYVREGDAKNDIRITIKFITEIQYHLLLQLKIWKKKFKLQKTNRSLMLDFGEE